MDLELVGGVLVPGLVLELSKAVGSSLDGVGGLRQLVVDYLAEIAVGVELALGCKSVRELRQTLLVAYYCGGVVDDNVDYLLSIMVVYSY